MKEAKQFDEKANNFVQEDFRDHQNDSKADEYDSEEKEYVLPYTIKLEDSFELGKHSYDEVVVVRKPKLKDVKHLPINPEQIQLGHFVKPIASMLGKPIAFVDEFSRRDFDKLLDVFNFFM